MAEDDVARPAITGRALLSALLGAVGTGTMGLAGRELLDIAMTSAGTEALIAWVLVGAAALGVLLCFRLALIWTLAAAVLAAGPRGRTGVALLAALRLLAPRLARRLTTGAALATAATALTLGPALAAPASVLLEDDGVRDAPVLTVQMLPVDAPAPSDGGGGDEAEPATPPPLGWGESASPPPSPEAGQDEAAPASRTEDDELPVSSPGSAPRSDAGSTADHATEPDVDAESSADPPTGTDTATETDTAADAIADTDTATETDRTVTVRTGDSLWSISRDLLGQGAATDPEIAAAWPLLHAANQDRIGADPDLLHPGLELVVPAELTSQDMP